ncbi:DUF4190 domain-containing protein [Streptomyces sp. NPDC001606]
MSDESAWSAPGEYGTGDRSTAPGVSLDKGAASAPGRTGPAQDAVHYQETVTSLPSVPDPAPWAPPTAGPYAPPANPFTPPSAPQPAAQPNPFAPPAPMAPAAGEPVPPPPIAPTGPGPVSYGYPPQASYPGAGVPGYPMANGYGWSGMPAQPSNGMGTASLVLGIISAVGFLLWPVALIVGVLAVIFGAVGRAKVTRGEATKPGMALAGMICGGVGFVLAAAFLALIIAMNA